MKKHYLVFKKDESFLGFTSIDPTLSSGIIYTYIEVDEVSYKEAKSSFERGKKLELNDEKTYFVTK